MATTTRKRQTKTRARRQQFAHPKPLFDVGAYTKRKLDSVLETVPLEQFELAPNPRKEISEEGIDRMAYSLATTGQITPLIARRVAEDKVLVYAGQRRLLGAKRSHELAGSDGYEDISPVTGLFALMLDFEPTEADIRRIQAHENEHEQISLRDAQQAFEDCWLEKAGLPEDQRLLAVCADLSITAKKARNLLRQITLAAPIRERVSDRPVDDEISVTMANKLADMNEVAPALTVAVADRLTDQDLHQRALNDMGSFVHRTVVENDRVYAVRIDDGALLDAHDQLERAIEQLTSDQRRQLEAVLLADVVDDDKRDLDAKLKELSQSAKREAFKVRVDATLRDRAKNGRYAYVHARGRDFADGIWIVDPVFMIGVIAEQLQDGATGERARNESYFKGSGVKDAALEEAGHNDQRDREEQRARRSHAAERNLGLGSDIAAGLMDPRDDQLSGLRTVVCLLLAQKFGDVISYGAAWTDRDRQQPVGDHGSYEPRQTAAICDAELQRALDDPDPLRGIAQLVARFGAAFMLDPNGPSKGKALGLDRMARRLRETLPGGEGDLRKALWEFMRPMLSPALVDMHRPAFVVEEETHTVDLAAHRGESALDDIELPDGDEAA